jgi:hypothetical protein
MVDRPEEMIAEREALERRIARALHVALRRAEPNAWVEDSPDDAETWDRITVDGKFRFRLVAKYLMQELERG